MSLERDYNRTLEQIVVRTNSAKRHIATVAYGARLRVRLKRIEYYSTLFYHGLEDVLVVLYIPGPLQFL